MWLLPSLWRRLASLTLVDCFLFSIAMYFGAYTVIDSVTAEAVRTDPVSVSAVFLMISFSTLILWAFARSAPKLIQETSFARLREDWRACAAWPIIGVVAIALAYRWFTLTIFSEYEGLNPQIVEQDLPYWFTSLGMIAT